MRNAQVNVLSVVILTGIVLSLVTVTYVWAGPLINKNVDKSNVQSILNFMEDLNDDILYVAEKGSSRVIEMSLDSASFIVDSDSNRIVVETVSTVPYINSVTEVPLSGGELAYVSESFNINTSNSDTSQSISGYESTSKYNNVSIEGVEYNVSIFENTNSGTFDLLCLWKDTLTYSNDCGQVDESIIKEGTTYDISYIGSTGESALFIGGTIENTGLFGSSQSGIISGKGFSINDKEYITFYLTYRGLLSEDSTEYKIFLNCTSVCAFSDENKEIVISRSNVVRTNENVYTYINIGVQ